MKHIKLFEGFLNEDAARDYLYYKELVDDDNKAYKNATGGEAEEIMQNLVYNRKMMNKAKALLKKAGKPLPKANESEINEAQKLIGFNGEELKIGDKVEVKFLTGRYGETTVKKGILVSVDSYRGENRDNSDVTIKLELDKPYTKYPGTATPSHQIGMFTSTYKDGDKMKVSVGFGKGGYRYNDYEHGHTTYIKKI